MRFLVESFEKAEQLEQRMWTVEFFVQAEGRSYKIELFMPLHCEWVVNLASALRKWL